MCGFGFQIVDLGAVFLDLAAEFGLMHIFGEYKAGVVNVVTDIIDVREDCYDEQIEVKHPT